MKFTCVLFISLLFSLNGIAQNISQDNVPAVVLNSFQLKFPNATDAKWKQEGNSYHIKFKVNNKFNELYLDYRGKMLKYHQDLWGSEVPENVIRTIKSRVEFFDLDDADFMKEGTLAWYEINFEIEGKDRDFWINEKGKLLKYRKELKNSEIPSSIVALINQNYGTLDIDRAKYVEEDGKGIYIIRGEINGSDHIFTISNKNLVLKHEQDLRSSEIPAPILGTLNKSYQGYDIRDADLIQEGENSNYILRIRSSKEQRYVTFDANGIVINVK